MLKLQIERRAPGLTRRLQGGVVPNLLRGIQEPALLTHVPVEFDPIARGTPRTVEQLSIRPCLDQIEEDRPLRLRAVGASRSPALDRRPGLFLGLDAGECRAGDAIITLGFHNPAFGY
jgi:hypothetical protein